MGKLERQIQRAQAKKAYKGFGLAWDSEKTAQKATVAEEGKLPENVRPLGHKPTLRSFGKFMQAAPRVPMRQETLMPEISATNPEEAVPTVGLSVPVEEVIEKEWKEN